MPGFSLTLLLLPTALDGNAPSTTKILSLLDEKTEAPGWRWSSGSIPKPLTEATKTPSTTNIQSTKNYPKLSALDASAFISSIRNACNSVIAAEPVITQMDNIAGDGDAGLTLKAGAEGPLDRHLEL